MNDAYNTAERLRLVELGYKIVPNFDKRCFLDEWNIDGAAEREMEEVALWPGTHSRWKATGLLMRDGVASIDIDINDAAGAAALLQEISRIAPEVGDKAPTRYSEGTCKAMVFCRVDLTSPDLFFKSKSRAFFRPGEENVRGADHKVELFGGGRNEAGKFWQCGIYGPRSHNDAGEVDSRYVWDEGRPPLHEVALAELPLIAPKQLYAIADAFEAWATTAGWVGGEPRDTASEKRVYDITTESRFDTNKGGVGLTYDELASELVRYGDFGLRCKGSFIPGWKGSERDDHCGVFHSPRHDCTAVFVHGDEAVHYPVKFAPVDRAALGETLRGLGYEPKAKTTPKDPPAAGGQPPGDEPPEPDYDKSSFLEKVDWLVQTRGFLESEDRVIRLYAGTDCRVKPSAFANRYRAWFNPPAPPRKTPTPATAMWEVHPGRTHLDGVAMRPDKAFPVFVEQGRRFKNSYLPPRHDRIVVTKDQIATATELFGALVRNLATGPGEAEYLLRYVSYKMQNPAVPGCGVFFVNPVFGSGRDLFFAILVALLGPQNTSKQDISRLIGDGGRASFNAYLAERVLVYVPEVLDQEHRIATFNKLKSIIDPRAGDHVSVNRKGIEEYDAIRIASVMMATNYLDAVRIEAEDRRLSVLAGGPALDDALGQRLELWRAHPVNIAALWRYLLTIDLAGYKPYVPLHTEAKAQMIELGTDRVLKTLQAIAEDATRTWKVFTIDQLETLVEHAMGVGDSSRSDKIRNLDFRHRNARGRLVVAAMSRGTTKQRRIRFNNQQVYLYCFISDRDTVAKMTDAEAKEAMPVADFSEMGKKTNT